MSSRRELAERHLLALVTFASGSRPLLRESEPRELVDIKRRLRLEAASAMFVELGVIGEADVGPFRARLETAIARSDYERSAPVDGDLASRARELLGRGLAPVADNSDLPRMPATLERPVRTSLTHTEAIARFEALVQASKACGALSDDELSEWRARLLEVDDGRNWHLERERRQKCCKLTELRGVVRGERKSGGPVQVTTAELYSGGVILLWHERGGSLSAPRTEADHADHAKPGRRHVSLSDDLGTEYLHFHTNESHTGAAVLWTARFATPVPSGARKLVAEIRDQRFSLPLADEAGGW